MYVFCSAFFLFATQTTRFLFSAVRGIYFTSMDFFELRCLVVDNTSFSNFCLVLTVSVVGYIYVCKSIVVGKFSTILCSRDKWAAKGFPAVCFQTGCEENTDL